MYSIKRHKKYMLIIPVVLLLAGLISPIQDAVFDQPYATVLESREGHLLGARIASDGQWRFPPIDSLPENYLHCLLEYEDRYFFKHPGINPFSIIRAIRQNHKEGMVVSGGSTITMQVARMAMGNKPRNIYQKLKEMWLALQLEMKYSKEEILLLYANNAPFGGNVVGISAAAWRYYGRSVYHLSWAEVANLAVLPNAPSLVFPGKNETLLMNKRNRVLEKLYYRSIIEKSTFAMALMEPVPGKPKPLPMLAQHLVNRTIRDGYGQKRTKSTLSKIYQIHVNQLVNNYNLKYKYKEIHNVAALVAEIKTGDVLAYVGNAGSNFSGEHGSQVDIISSKRSPGSLLKPILYALSIDKGLIMPGELLPDIPLYYQGFAPQNFDKRFKGAVPANLALRSSLNVPFVSLLRDYSYEQFHYDLKKIGVTSLTKPAGHYGLSIILGGGEVTLWEMAGLYASLVRNLESYTVNKGVNRYISSDFRPLNYSYRKEAVKQERIPRAHVSASATWHTLKAMQELRRPDAETNWQQFGSRQSIAWKTGTSYGHKDAWAIGLNNKYIVAVWMGNADGEGRPDLTGVLAAAPLMFRIFETMDGKGVFPMPLAEMDMISICQQSGLRASNICPESKIEAISRRARSTATCNYHHMLHLTESGTFQVNSSCYPVSKMISKSWFILPPSQARYYKSYNINYIEPPEFTKGCFTTTNEILEMIYPKTHTKVFVPVEIDGAHGKVVFEAAHQNPETKVFWYLDDAYKGETRSIHQMGLFPSAGLHQLSVVDEHGREINISFEAVNSQKL